MSTRGRQQKSDDPGRRRAGRLPAPQRREEILAVASRLFSEKGYAATGTSDIARAVGVAEPTIYRYFGGKQDLYLQVLEWNAAFIQENWQRIAESHENAFQALLELGQWYLDQLEGSPGPFQLHFRSVAESHDPLVAEVVAREYLKLESFLESLLEKAQEQGDVRQDADVKTITWSFLALGALIDVTRLLGIENHLTQERLAAMAALFVLGRVDDGPDY